jgi:outer membrane protein assembly factor BamA
MSLPNRPYWILALLFPTLGFAEEVAVSSDSTAADRLSRPRRQRLVGGRAGQTVGAVRWMAKRQQIRIRGRDYGATGLPIVYYSSSSGWNRGVRVQVADYSRRPYRYKFTFHSINSTKGKRTNYLRLKVPHISGTGWGIQMRLSSLRDIRARYYGLSNDSDRNENFTDPKNPDFKDEDYYFYILEQPSVLLRLVRAIYGPVSLSVGLGLGRNEVSPAGDLSFYVQEGTPDGVVDGVSGFISFTLVWDTRDDPTIPREGLFQEWSYETSRNSLFGLFFEEIDFQRYTVTDARYYPISERLNIAHRTIFEALKGAVPLFAYGEFGGSLRVRGLGGSDTLRGFDRQRFTDNIRLATNTEARYHLGSRRFLKQYFELHCIGFLDMGQVSPGVKGLAFGDTHVTTGIGLRTYWNADFVLRAEVGRSAEQVFTSFKYRNIF